MTAARPTGRPAPRAGALVRALQLVAIAAAVALVALVIDARGRPAPTETQVVLLPTPPGEPPRPPRPFVPRPAPPPAAEPAPPETLVAPPPDRGGTPEPATAPVVATGPPAAAGEAAPAAAGPTPPAETAAATPPPPPDATREAAAPVASPPPAPAPAPAPATAGGTVRDGVLAYQAGDYERAHAIWRPLAEAGNARARFHLGALYLEGRLGRPDPEAAYRWLARAAEAGQSAAVPLRDQAAAALPPERLAAIRAELGLP